VFAAKNAARNAQRSAKIKGVPGCESGAPRVIHRKAQPKYNPCEFKNQMGGLRMEQIDNICRQYGLTNYHDPNVKGGDVFFNSMMGLVITGDYVNPDNIPILMEKIKNAGLDSTAIKFIQTVRSAMDVSIVSDNRDMFKMVKHIEKEALFQDALLYKIGFIQGQRQERARRKAAHNRYVKGGAAV
jgi:hypothetical protein